MPGLPHHVTQRGNRRERVFFGDDDYRLYRDLLREACDKAGVSVWAYCLMPNHVHLILTPTTADGLARALSGRNNSELKQVSPDLKCHRIQHQIQQETEYFRRKILLHWWLLRQICS